jgi:hypothetical protein
MFPNVNETNNCIRIIVSKPPHNLDIVLPIGCYEIEDMAQFICSKIHDDNEQYLKSDITYTPTDFAMVPDIVKMRCVINCNCRIDFTVENSIASILGFKNKIYGEGNYLSGFMSERNININAVNSIKVLCNIANGSFNNGLQSHSIYEFFPHERSGTKIVESPTNLIYYKLNTDVINTINIDLVDQENNRIHNFNEKITVVLHVRCCKS